MNQKRFPDLPPPAGSTARSLMKALLFQHCTDRQTDGPDRNQNSQLGIITRIIGYQSIVPVVRKPATSASMAWLNQLVMGGAIRSFVERGCAGISWPCTG